MEHAQPHRQLTADPEGLSLPEAARASGLAVPTLRRHIRQGRLAVGYVPGPFGREVRVPREELARFCRARGAAGFDRPTAPPSVREPTLAELATWAERPAVRMAFLGWARTASTVTPSTALAWIRNQFRAETP